MHLLLRADQRLKQNHEDVLLPANLQELYLSGKELGLKMSQELDSLIAYPVSKQLTSLLRHGHLPREEDGAIEFWRLQDYMRNDFVHSRRWSDEMWKSKMAGGGNEKRFQYCTDPSGQEILYLRALQGRSRRDLIDPSLPDNVFIHSERFLRVHLTYWMCGHFTLHHKFRFDSGKTKFKQRKTDGILHVCGSYEQRTQRSEQN